MCAFSSQATVIAEISEWQSGQSAKRLLSPGVDAKSALEEIQANCRLERVAEAFERAPVVGKENSSGGGPGDPRGRREVDPGGVGDPDRAAELLRRATNPNAQVYNLDNTGEAIMMNTSTFLRGWNLSGNWRRLGTHKLKRTAGNAWFNGL